MPSITPLTPVGQIPSDRIVDGAVTTSKILDAAVTEDKVGGNFMLAGGIGHHFDRKSINYEFRNGSATGSGMTAALAGAGTNTYPATNFHGAIQNNTTANGADKARTFTTSSFYPEDFTNGVYIVEFDCKWLIAPTNGQFSSVGITTVSAELGGRTTNSMGLGFNLDNASNTWTFVSQDGAAAETDTLVGFTPTSWHKIRFELAPIACRCYVDGVQVGTTHTTRVPQQGVAYYAISGIENNAVAAATQLEVRNIRVVLV